MLARGELSVVDPIKYLLTSLLGDFELDRPLGLLLHDDDAMKYASAL
jgi:hypothetical protein